MVAADVYRPAAVDQLIVLGGQIDIPVYSEKENKNPVDIALNGIAHAKSLGLRFSNYRYCRSFSC
jgi:signal recognition particle subunit SRP54